MSLYDDAGARRARDDGQPDRGPTGREGLKLAARAHLMILAAVVAYYASSAKARAGACAAAWSSRCTVPAAGDRTDDVRDARVARREDVPAAMPAAMTLLADAAGRAPIIGPVPQPQTARAGRHRGTLATDRRGT